MGEVTIISGLRKVNIIMQVGEKQIFKDNYSGKFFCGVSNDRCVDGMAKNGICEFSLIDWSKQFMKKDGVFIDVGANIGTYSVILSSLCKTVHSFEPQIDNFECLTVSSLINNIRNIKLHNCALGEKKGLSLLTQTTRDGGSATLDPEMRTIHGGEIIKNQEVMVNTLDSFQIEDICFIKIDVEGFELQVLKGAVETIKKSRYPPILFEWNRYDHLIKRGEELFNYLKSLGYKIHPISSYSNMYLASDHPER